MQNRHQTTLARNRLLVLAAPVFLLTASLSIAASAGANANAGASAGAAPETRVTKVALLPTSPPPSPTNPRANGYQIAYFERGFSDGMTNPVRRAEFIACLRTLNPSSLRFPGGTWAYWYSDVSPKSVAAFARLDQAPYWTKNFSAYRWTNDDYFFGICKELGVTAIYQLNIGAWYDAASDRAVKLAPFDRRMKDGLDAARIAQSGKSAGTIDAIPEMKDVEVSFMKDATAHAARLARKVKALGVDVIWEFGNEDYTNFKPASYVRQCHAFYAAIRAAVPEARFAFCADGDSWSDHAWDTAVYAELVKNGMADMAEASAHMYLTGGGGGPRDNGANLYKATRAAWGQLRHMHDGWRKRLAEAGLKQAKISLTEYNALHVVKNCTGTALEHSMGRALGEASIWPDLVKRFNYIVHHDFIRNGYGSGTWFARMYYMADNPEGFRYVLPLDGKVMAVMHRHAANRILYNDNCVVVSQGQDGLLVSIGNELATGVRHEIRLAGERAAGIGNGVRPLKMQTLATPDLGASEHVEFETAAAVAQGIITVRAPAFSFSYASIPLR
ncbi:MAG: hypothetical protein LBK99_17990 [Opitutaceae bacterium]|jgi:hypothetical protein|nr:hypothetical protein [Opitutaceae bacterium]